MLINCVITRSSASTIKRLNVICISVVLIELFVLCTFLSNESISLELKGAYGNVSNRKCYLSDEFFYYNGSLSRFQNNYLIARHRGFDEITHKSQEFTKLS